MTIDNELDRAEWIRQHLRQIPYLIQHIRMQRFPSMQAAMGPRVSTGSDPARPPLSVDPLDDADELWSAICLIALVLEDRTKNRAPVEFEQQRTTTAKGGGRQVQGFPTTDALTIDRMVYELVMWLDSHSITIALHDAYRDGVEHLTETVGEMRRKYPDAPKPFRARMRCPKCGEHAVTKTYDLRGEIEALMCEACGAKRVF